MALPPTPAPHQPATDIPRPPDLVVPTQVLSDDSTVVVFRPALALTLYLDEPLLWAREGARGALLAFLERVNPRELQLFTTSLKPGYHRITGADMARLLHDLALPPARQAVRDLFWLRIVDDADAARLGFEYREIDDRRTRRCGFLQLTLPADYDPRVLAELAALLAGKWPVLAGVGGYALSWNLREAATAQGAAFAVCKRFLGLDLQDPEEMAWQVPRGLPGTGWLTVLGKRHAEGLEIDLGALERQAWTGAVEVRALAPSGAVLLRAGQAPTLGDLNRLAYPSAYAEVARALERHLVAEPPPFMGERWNEEPDFTARWLRRLVDPEKWR